MSNGVTSAKMKKVFRPTTQQHNLYTESVPITDL